jgi:hypothetical protein
MKKVVFRLRGSHARALPHRSNSRALLCLGLQVCSPLSNDMTDIKARIDFTCYAWGLCLSLYVQLYM